MAFRDLVGGARNGNDAAIRLSDGSTPGSVLSDTKDLAVETVGVHANGNGDIRVMLHDGSTATLTLAACVDYPYRVRRFYATGTTLTAAQIVLFYSKV